MVWLLAQLLVSVTRAFGSPSLCFSLTTWPLRQSGITSALMQTVDASSVPVLLLPSTDRIPHSKFKVSYPVVTDDIPVAASDFSNCTSLRALMLLSDCTLVQALTVDVWGRLEPPT
ncbi:unnamed protein product [Taenia asiatica]|uniref:Secreted protein n=1 Tax=Taenia asiatica TaxID=60517 RepID=A0A0R3WGA3_TAEAS|nr:unnamed protein product [Taenia asiatica]